MAPASPPSPFACRWGERDTAAAAAELLLHSHPLFAPLAPAARRVAFAQVRARAWTGGGREGPQPAVFAPLPICACTLRAPEWGGCGGGSPPPDSLYVVARGTSPRCFFLPPLTPGAPAPPISPPPPQLRFERRRPMDTLFRVGDEYDAVHVLLSGCLRLDDVTAGKGPCFVEPVRGGDERGEGG